MFAVCTCSLSGAMLNPILPAPDNFLHCRPPECAPVAAVACDADFEVCVPGAVGYNCVAGKRGCTVTNRRNASLPFVADMQLLANR